MNDIQFFNNLGATYMDARKLDVKKINLKGKNILDYISDAEFDSYDTRDPELKNDELDIWNTEISLSEEGHIEVKPHVHGIKYNEDIVYEGITESQHNILKTAVKIIGNEVLGDNDEHIMYWQTDGLTVGVGMLSDTNLESFLSDLSSLTDGEGMFFNCSSLTSFSSDLSSLINGNSMFLYCYNLESFNSDLSNLMDGRYMFYGCNINSFSSEFPSLTEGHHMFNYCNNLESFNSNLSSLTDGDSMFNACSNLTSFTSDLSSLTRGYEMFNSCKLDAQSVANIVHALPTHETNGDILIGIGCDVTEADQLLFAQECDCEDWQELLDDFSAKNWTVEFQCNGRPTETATYNMRRGGTLPIYTKLVEVIMPTDEKERKPHYAYTSQDGSKFYNINYFHSTNGSTEGYDVFSSLEEAISTYNVTPKN